MGRVFIGVLSLIFKHKISNGLLYSKINMLFAKLRLKTNKHSIKRMSDIQKFYILQQLEQFTSTNHRLIYC